MLRLQESRARRRGPPCRPPTSIVICNPLHHMSHGLVNAQRAKPGCSTTRFPAVAPSPPPPRPTTTDPSPAPIPNPHYPTETPSRNPTLQGDVRQPRIPVPAKRRQPGPYSHACPNPHGCACRTGSACRQQYLTAGKIRMPLCAQLKRGAQKLRTPPWRVAQPATEAGNHNDPWQQPRTLVTCPRTKVTPPPGLRGGGSCCFSPSRKH